MKFHVGLFFFFFSSVLFSSIPFSPLFLLFLCTQYISNLDAIGSCCVPVWRVPFGISWWSEHDVRMIAASNMNRIRVLSTGTNWFTLCAIVGATHSSHSLSQWRFSICQLQARCCWPTNLQMYRRVSFISQSSLTLFVSVSHTHTQFWCSSK